MLTRSIVSNGRLAEKKIKPIQVKAPYATAEEKLIFPVEAFEEAIVIEAPKLPGIDDHFGDNELDQPVIGIFSKPLSGKVLPTPGDYTGPEDRVETFVPLLLDPKPDRFNRSEK